MSNSRRVSFLASVLILLVVVACNRDKIVLVKGTYDTLSERVYLTDPEIDPYPMVGSLHDKYEGLIGSCVLIGNRTVLTAAHCVQQNDVSTVRMGGRLYDVRCYYMHPDYIPHDEISGLADIAIIKLYENPDVEYAGINSLSTKHLRGISLDIVGFSPGVKSMNKSGTAQLYGTLEDTDTIKWLANRHQAQSGDSGGGVFINNTRQPILIAVVTANLKHNLVGPLDSTAVRVDIYYSWILKHLGNDDLPETE